MVETDEEKEFCAAVGELILWTSVIDSQLTKAVILLYQLGASPMVENVIAELPLQRKIALIHAYLKQITNRDWSQKIKDWTNKVEKVNGYRNIAAHHIINRDKGKLVLIPAQATKVLKRISNLNKVDGAEIEASKTLDDICEWAKVAEEMGNQGEEVLSNLVKLEQERERRSRRKSG